MVRRPRPKTHQTRAYWHSGDLKRAFWCKISVSKASRSDFGHTYESDGVDIETVSDIEFAINDIIYVGNNKYTIEDIPPSTPTDMKHGGRGQVQFLKRLRCS